MTKISYILLFISLPASAQIKVDKQLHFYAGNAIGFSATGFTINKPMPERFVWSVGSATVIGISKELVYDKWCGKGTPEWKDAAWTIAGGVTGWAVMEGIRWVNKRSEQRFVRRTGNNRIQ